MKKSEQINEIATALAKAQAEIKGAVADSENPHYKSKYADLASVWEACRAPLTKNGLSVSQTFEQTEGRTVLTTLLLHSSGQWIESTLPISPVRNDPQGVGSAITYMRRYALSALVGIAPEDDDGNAASGKEPPEVKKHEPVKNGKAISIPVKTAKTSEVKTPSEFGL